MRIVVIGGTGQVGSKVVQGLARHGHDAVSASQESGVDIISGNGLREALDDADVVVDVTNKITMEREAAIGFFETAARNVLEAEVAAGVKHHVALSVLRSDRLTESGYIAGKVAQEQHVEKGAVPYTLVRAAQFFELVPMMVQAGAVDGVTRLAGVKFQPIAAADVAETLIERVLAGPIDGSYEIAGPEVFRIDELAKRWARETGSTARIEMDPDGTYFGAPLEDETLLPGHDVHVRATTFEQWLASQPAPTSA
ncbi:SDR family oxidoreductase [Sphingobium yanoikuyae]